MCPRSFRGHRSTEVFYRCVLLAFCLVQRIGSRLIANSSRWQPNLQLCSRRSAKAARPRHRANARRRSKTALRENHQKPVLFRGFRCQNAVFPARQGTGARAAVSVLGAPGFPSRMPPNTLIREGKLTQITIFHYKTKQNQAFELTGRHDAPQGYTNHPASSKNDTQGSKNYPHGSKIEPQGSRTHEQKQKSAVLPQTPPTNASHPLSRGGMCEAL